MTPSFANSWPWLFNTLNNAKVDNLTLRDALLDELRKQAYILSVLTPNGPLLTVRVMVYEPAST